MRSAEILTDGFDRIRSIVHAAVKDARSELLTFRPDDNSNSIAWLVWHLTRVQDDHIADAAGSSQVWTSDGWAGKFELPFDESATGYGHGSDDVAAVRAEAGLLTGYHDVVHARTVAFISTINDNDLSTVVDTSWNPPVALATRLVSVLSDNLQHAGQAAYVRGIFERTREGA